MPQTLELMRAILHHAPSEIGYARLCALPLLHKAECDYARDGLRQWGDFWTERLEVKPPEGGLASLAQLAQAEIEDAMERCDDLQEVGEQIGIINGTWLECLAQEGLVFNPHTWNIVHDYPKERMVHELEIYGSILEDDPLVERLTCTSGDLHTWLWLDHHSDFFIIEDDERLYDAASITPNFVHPLLQQVPVSLAQLHQHLKHKVLILHDALPSFGGLPPKEHTRRVWSWDVERLLVGERLDTLAMVRRGVM